MTIKNFVKLFVLLLLLLSLQCCKEKNTDEIINYPVVYSNTPTTIKFVKVFTKNGEITNSIAANNLINKYSYLLIGINSYQSGENITATYLNSENVAIRKQGSDSSDTLKVHNNTDLIYWEKKNTTSEPVSSTYDIYYIKTMFKYKPLYYEEFAMPPSTGYSKVAKYKQCYSVKKDGENLVLPMLDFFYKMGNDINNYSLEINNEFCNDSTSAIGANDTLIICGYSLELKKQPINNKN